MRQDAGAGGEARVKVCAVIPAYNEGKRILPVLNTLDAAASVHEILVVDDGSLDDTFAVACSHPACETGRIRVLQHNPNRGKGAAMRTGAETTSAEVIVFFDADLVGLTPAHVNSVVLPVASGRAAMALGVFRGGRGATTLAQILAPNISGQRAIRRDVFQSIPCLTKAGYGVELAITNYVLGEGLPITRVVLNDVTHPMKEEKLGFFRGAASRMRMYWQMLPYLARGLFRRRRNRLVQKDRLE
ncbi:MAG: glycosyltransferase family 2 protein [Cytophagales bacterium]|nr:glycosyltransferase family 2 protein [Armatimonadota bacterium]